MQKTVHLCWPKLSFSEKDMGNCLCYDISDEANRWEQKRDQQSAKWKSVDCGTAGMKDYTKDAMGGVTQGHNSQEMRVIAIHNGD